MKVSWILDMDRENPVPMAGGTDRHLRPRWALVPVALLLAALVVLGGCSEDECVNCVQLESPPAPSGVYTTSGDDEIVVYWNDIYFERPDRVTLYRIYSRFFSDGDQNDPDRVFYLIGEVAWDENFDGNTGQHWFVDDEVVNGESYEYAVSAVNAAGLESPLSFELVIDTPLPVSESPVEVFDFNGPLSGLSGFDFSLAAGGTGHDGRLDPAAPGTPADIQIAYRAGVPYVETLRPNVRIQDYGTFLSDDGTEFYFDAVSWAPENGYSTTGVLEVVYGHVYIVEIVEPGTGELHYAKFGVTQVGAGSVRFLWAFQLVVGLPELRVPDRGGRDDVRVVSQFTPIKL